MSLLDRLIGTEEPKLPVHQFMAALAEGGFYPKSKVKTELGLTQD